MPKDATSIKMTAQYRDEEFDVTTAELQAVAFYSTRDFHIHVSTSTEQAELNEFAVFHMKSNFHFQDFSYVVRKLPYMFNSFLYIKIKVNKTFF